MSVGCNDVNDAMNHSEQHTESESYCRRVRRKREGTMIEKPNNQHYFIQQVENTATNKASLDRAFLFGGTRVQYFLKGA